MISTVIIFVSIACAIGQPVKYDSHDSDNDHFDVKRTVTEIVINDKFDKNLPTIRKFILNNGMDPMEVPDCEMPLSFPLIPGKIHLQKGWVQNLVTIKRTGDVIVRYDGLNMDFDVNLGWDNMDVTYDYTFRYFGITRKGLFHGRFNNVNLKIAGAVDLKTRHLKLHYLKFVDVDDFTLKLYGHLTDHLINILTRLLTSFAKERILHEIEYQSINIIEEKIKEINNSHQDILM